MAETMIRTQVYLPRRMHEKLKQRAERHGLTLAMQIRSALEDYLDRVEAEENDGILHADDPIFQMIGMFNSGLGDLSVNHDHYLYGAPRREPAEPPLAQLKDKATTAYKTRKSARRRRKTK